MKMSLSRIGMAALILGSCCGVQSAGAAEIGALALSDGLPAHGSFSREPAKAWEQAFFTGNGRMGAMVYGQPARQTIVANHCRLFLPLGNREIVPDLAPEVPALRRIIREQGYGAAMDFFLGKARQQGFPGIIPTDPFHPGFKLLLETGTLRPAAAESATSRNSDSDRADDYFRTEDFATGEVQVRWTDQGIRYVQKMFVSRTDNVIAVSVSRADHGAVSCRLRMEPIEHALVTSTLVHTQGLITCHNTYRKGKGGYEGVVRVVNHGGEQVSTGNEIRIAGADEILLLMRLVPWKTPLPKELSEAWAYSPENPDFSGQRLGVYQPAPPLADSSVVAFRNPQDAATLLPKVRASLAALPTDYDRLFRPHAKAHGALFNRVSLNLGGGTDRSKSTEELLDIAKNQNRLPAALMEKMYDASRYMLICSAGELAPNLQGIWTGTWSPAWSGDFTLDTNLQAAMASAGSANLTELMEGYFRLIESFYPEWRLNAKRIYGGRGFFSNARASNTCLLLHWGTWDGVFWTAGSGWLASFFTDYAAYTGDREFLAKRCVPLLKETAAFYQDFLAETDKDGRATFIPSYNPETGCGINATMDIAVAREVLGNLIAACRELKLEQDNLSTWESLLAKLPAYPVNDRGELAEWPGGGVSAEHRHHSQLYPCFQSFDPLFEVNPALRAAAQTTVRAKIAGSDGGGEQSLFGRVQCGVSAAFLGLPEEAYSRLQGMAVKRSMNPSLITSHEPNASILNTDGNGGIPQIVNTMLAFSQPGRLDLLPALPAAWPRGEIRGILARGQITISRLAWDKPAAQLTLELTSGKRQTLTLGLPTAAEIKSIKCTGATVKQSPKGLNYREVSLEAKAPAHLIINM